VHLTLPGQDASEEAGLARLAVLQANPDRAVRAAAYRAEGELLETTPSPSPPP
jgi:hypothetical protein